MRDLSFHLPSGKILGVLGRTGSGKTTLARLLLRFYEVQSGAIHLNGAPLQKIELDQVRRRIAMVTQDVQLFQGSVRDNLTFFKRHVSDEQIIAVLNELGLGRWLQALPDGLESELGGGGTGLSAGESQLLAFARVFLENPDLVLLDEASSRLDPATEQVVTHGPFGQRKACGDRRMTDPRESRREHLALARREWIVALREC